MSKLSSFFVTYAILLFCALATGLVSGDDEEEKKLITRDAINLTIPNPFGEIPIFETNDQNGRFVGIHIPYIFDLEFHYRGGLMNNKFKTTLLSGLLRADYDRVQLEDGKRHGPIQLSILGMSLYDNKEKPYV